jgi:hypothetical protein
MSVRQRAKMTADLVRGAAQFERWRQSRVRGARIPDRLWQLAVELASRQGISRTACALRVGYYELKKRLEDQGKRTPTTSRRSCESTFVELPPIATSIGRECLIELEKVTGAKLRIHLKGPAIPDLSALASTFWESR